MAETLMSDAELASIPTSLLLRDVIAHRCDLCARCREKWDEIDRRLPAPARPASNLEAAIDLVVRLQDFVRIDVSPTFPRLLKQVAAQIETLEPTLKKAAAELKQRFQAQHITLVWDHDYGLGLRVATPLTAEEAAPLRRAFAAWQAENQAEDQFWMGISFA